jgi:hypothetical protein
MTRPTFAAAAGIGVAIAFGFIGFGCSSSSSSSGTGGATGSGGTTGTGGHVGTGGATGTGGADAGAALPVCTSPAPGDGTACNSDPSCTKNCGLNTSTLVTGRAMKACTCSGPSGTWSCPSTNGACVYPAALDLACFHIPSPVPACPSQAGDGGADAGSPLIKSGGTSCVPPNSEVCGNLCGSASANTYLDGSNNPKMGYCVCINGVYQCASVNEWPPQQ